MVEQPNSPLRTRIPLSSFKLQRLLPAVTAGVSHHGLLNFCAGAIGINVISASDGGPVAYRGAIENDGVKLGELTVAVKVSHGHAADRDGNAGCGKDQAFDGESVIAP